MECEYPNCNDERKCFHYCSKHHQQVCVEGSSRLPSENAAQQSVQPTIESVRELPAEVVKVESVLPASSG